MVSSGFPNRSYFPALTLNHLWSATPFFLMLLKGFIFPLPLLDFWWHLRMGRLILETSAIPRVDVFSATATGKLYIVQNWLAEILFYLVYRAGGFPLLIFFNCILLVCTLIPIYCLCRRLSEHLRSAVFAASLVAICIPGNMRPQIFSFFLFSVFYWLLLSYRDRRQRQIWLLPALMILWVNLHGAFIVGLALVAIFLLCECIRSLLHQSPDALGARQIGVLAIVLALCGIATLANPEGYKVYDYILTVVNDPSSRQFVVEWQPPTISSIQGVIQFFLPFFLLTLVLIVSEKRPSLTEIALYAGFFIFGIMATRNSVWFLLIAAPLLARYIPHVKWARLFMRGQSSPNFLSDRRGSQKKQSSALNFAIAVAALAVVCMQSPWLRQVFRPGSLLEPGTPVAAMDFIEKHPLNGNICHPQTYGDYLIWRLWPKQRSFFDGRVHLFGESFVNSYKQILVDSHWEELLKQYDIQYLLLAKDQAKPEEMRMIDDARKSRGWKLLYEDRLTILFEKVPA